MPLSPLACHGTFPVPPSTPREHAHSPPMQYNGQHQHQPPSLANAPAVSSKRMAYGAISSQGRETRDRQELLAGAAQPHGAAPQQQPREQQHEEPQEELNNAQLMQRGLAQHRDTTMTTRRALQIVEQTKEIQGSTQVALADQREQMGRIEDDLDRIGQDLTYSERILRFMKLCCCVGFFCSCCTEPARNTRDRHWRGPGAPSQQSHVAPTPQSMGQQQQRGGSRKQQQQAAAAHNGSTAYPGVSTHGLAAAGLGEQAAAIDQETAQQNQYLDEISKGLDQLKFGAQRINEELRYQDSHADRIRRDADTLEVKLHAVNREGFRRI